MGIISRIVEKSITDTKKSSDRDEEDFLLDEGAMQRKRDDKRAYSGGTDTGNRATRWSSYGYVTALPDPTWVFRLANVEIKHSLY